ncbi:MAG TPA: hypothetical protein PL059_01295 [Spirochaetota bacterium]|nr:hypothetical protein [Spirochaetota bacterium]HOM09901.1 hypothetical protein [Spirochaetota bacterium]HPP48754.1 hypothetical protein [Spirochaetota bacterium]
MRKIIITILFITFTHHVYAQYYIRNTTVIDTPTAYTIARGTYQLSFLGYDNGGVELKAFIGLHNNFFLGASLDIQNAIGKDDPDPNVPGVVGKIKFTDGWEMFPISFAIGYDSFYIGEEGKTYNSKNELNQMIYGPYFVITKPIYLFNDEQHIHFGMRIPTQPEYVPEDTSYFLALDIPLGEIFIFKAEMERVYYNFDRADEWLYNVGMRYSYMQRLGIEFDVLFQKDENPNRIIRIEYINEF